MKVSDTEWQFDRNKLTIYFTAEKRVDFRALVRDLASTFRTRIELRQIGVRDEAARLSGRGTLRPGVLLLHLAQGALAGQPGPRQGPAPVAQSRRRSPAAAAGCSAASSTSTSSTSPRASVSPRRARRCARPRGVERVDGGGHLPGAGLSPERGAGLPDHSACFSSARRSKAWATCCSPASCAPGWPTRPRPRGP